MSWTRCLLYVVSFVGFAVASQAQQAPPPNPMRVLQITQELVKPGKGAAHANVEAGWPAAFAKAGSKDHYWGLVAMTGINDALFITPYPSLSALEQSGEWMEKAPGLQASLDRLADKDGDLLTGIRSMIATRMDEASVGTVGDMTKVHGMLIRTSRVRIGHTTDFMEYMKLVKEGYEKAGVDPHIGTYVVTAGSAVPTYLTFRGFHGIGEMDEWPAMGDKMRAALTPEQRDRMDKLAEGAFTARDAEIYMINPRMSYVSAQAIAADPTFWKFWKANPGALAANASKSEVRQAGAPKDEMRTEKSAVKKP